MSSEAYANWHKAGGYPETCYWMTEAPPGKQSNVVRSKVKEQCVTNNEAFAYICEKAGKDVSPPEPVRQLSVRRFRENAIIGFKEPHDQGTNSRNFKTLKDVFRKESLEVRDSVVCIESERHEAFQFCIWEHCSQR